MSPGPCDYNTVQPKASKCSVRYKKHSISIKSLNKNNPLNYVVPITVNFYFKKSNPGPGEYSPEKALQSFKNGHKN